MSTPPFQLNPQQLEAVHYLGGPLFVLAGAGSGKTRVITEKIAHLIREVGYAPHNIAAITFTNKAAAEMQERTAAMLGSRQTRGSTCEKTAPEPERPRRYRKARYADEPHGRAGD